MATHRFSLAVWGIDLSSPLNVQTISDACNGIVEVSATPHGQFLVFEREADSFPSALFSALEDVRNVKGVSSVELDNSDNAHLR